MMRKTCFVKLFIVIGMLVYFVGCSRNSRPSFNKNAFFFNAIMVPSDQPIMNVGIFKENLRNRLSVDKSSDSPLAKAAGEALKILLKKGSRLSIKKTVPEKFAVPNIDYLSHFGIGFSRDDCLKCASAAQIFLLEFSCLPTQVMKLYPAYEALSLEAARVASGYIYDVNSKMIFTSQLYEQRNFSEGEYDFRNDILVQKYPYEPGSYRVVTLGMAKFGAPEIEVRDFSPNTSIAFQYLVYAVAHKIATLSITRKPDQAFPTELVLHRDYVRDCLKMQPGENFSKKPSGIEIKVELVRGVADKGDPQKNIVRILPPPSYKGDIDKWSSFVSRTLMGFEDKVNYIQDKRVSKETYKKVQSTLSHLKKLFKLSSGHGEYYIKFAYPVEGHGAEFLWLRLKEWSGESIKGVLISEPVLAKMLSAGEAIEIKPKWIVDWIYKGKNGKIEGNFTNSVIVHPLSVK